MHNFFIIDFMSLILVIKGWDLGGLGWSLGVPLHNCFLPLVIDIIITLKFGDNIVYSSLNYYMSQK